MEDIQKYEPQAVNIDAFQMEEGGTQRPDNNIRLMKTMLRYWYMIVLGLLVVGGAGVPAVWYMIRQNYQAMGHIEILQDVPPVLDEIEQFYPGINLNDQASLMTRDRILYRVFDLLKDEKLEFFEVKEPAEKKGENGLEEVVQNVKGFFSLPKPDTPIEKLQAAIDNGTITISPRKKSNLIDVYMVDENPEEAKKIVNAFLDAYMDVEGLQLSQSTEKKIELLEQESNYITTNIKLKEEAIRQMAEEYGSIELTPQQEMMLKNVETIQQQLLNVQSKRLELTVRIKGLEKSKNQIGMETALIQQQQSFIREDPLYISLTNRIAELEENLVKARVDMQEDNPEIKRLTDLLAAYRKSLEEREEELIESFKSDYVSNYYQNRKDQLDIVRAELEQIKIQEEVLKEELKKFDTSAKKLGNKQLDIEQAKTEKEMLKDLLERVQRRVQDLKMEKKRDPRITVHSAMVSPLENKRMKLSLAMIMAGLGSGLFFAFLLARADHNLYTPDDIIQCVGLPIIGTTSSSEELSRTEIVEQTAYDYQAIRANLGIFGDGQIPHVLAVTSASKNEGKTTFAINLASSLAQSGNKVLLIDGDFRKPDIGRILNIADLSAGFPDILLGLKTPDEILHTISMTGLDVLVGDSPNAPAAIDQLSQSVAGECVREIARQYDHVIIDTPPVMVCPDALLWSKIAGSIVLCSLAGQTTSPELRETLERLNRAGIKILGTVLSNVKNKHSYNKYAYGYYGRYGKNNGKERKKKTEELRPLLLTQSIDQTDQN